ncbi:MAG: DNA-directed RNA polymerase, subunit E'' [Thermoprotei archaeon]|nr:DNA-directed RNA polymerase, subunit E'' [Thermoprotei archaeon]
MSSRRQKTNFKACVKCKLLVEPEVEVCPNCGSREFSTDWEGMIIVIDPEKSEAARLIGVKKPGRYAIKVR